MRRLHARRLAPILGLLFLIFLVPNAAPSAAASTPAHGVTGIIIPLYPYPGSDWSNLIWAKQVNPNVPMVAVINPSDGPGIFHDPNFVSGIDRLESAGITVLGYIWTNYGARSISSVEGDMAAYKNWYGVDGVYLDQMANVNGYQSYYSALTAYAKSIGMNTVVGNPGTTVPSSYIGTVSTLVIYENSGTPSTSLLSGLDGSVSKNNFAVLAYGVSSVNTKYLDAATNYVGYIYLTNGVWPNPYAPESSYLDNLATALQAYDAPASTSGSVTVTTVSMSGQAIRGLHASLWQGGIEVGSCFSPCTFAVQGGQTYRVEVSNYGPFVFTEWANGLVSRSFTIVEPSTATRIGLQAIYST